MTKHRYTNAVCCSLVGITFLLALLFGNGTALGISIAQSEMPYVDKLFSTDMVHSVNIVVDADDWQNILDNASEKTYISCNIVIDGEAVKNVGIRTKGNSSLSQVTTDRYSFKVEFDHYDSTKSYYGLDKLCLNNIIQDNTYLKDYICYDMFRSMGVPAPLASYAVVTVNDSYFGLYMAVEGVEDAFAERNFGANHGLLYKPDSVNGSGGGGMNSSDDVKLLYTDDDYDSYSHIFDQAAFDISDADRDRLISAIRQLNNGENLEEILDIDEVIRYFVVHNFVLNSDSYTGSLIHNYYLYEDNGVLSMLPWDYNLAFGAHSMGNATDSTGLVNYPIDDPLMNGDMDQLPMISWIFENEEYLELYHQIYDEFISSYFESGYFEELYAQVTALLTPYVAEDTTSFTTYDNYLTAAATLEEFCLLRAQSIRGQLDGAIPSTEDGQRADTSALIDASGISVSSMGSNAGRGGAQPDGGRQEQPGGDENRLGGGQPQMDGEAPFDGQQNLQEPAGQGDQGQSGVDQQRKENQPVQNFPDIHNDQPGGNRQGMENTDSSAASANQGLLLCVSVFVLLAGLAVAFKFRR